MKVTNTEVMNQKKISITYDNPRELELREPHIKQTLENYLERFGNKQYISNREVVVNTMGTLSLVYTLDIKE